MAEIFEERQYRAHHKQHLSPAFAFNTAHHTLQKRTHARNPTILNPRSLSTRALPPPPPLHPCTPCPPSSPIPSQRLFSNDRIPTPPCTRDQKRKKKSLASLITSHSSLNKNIPPAKTKDDPSISPPTIASTAHPSRARARAGFTNHAFGFLFFVFFGSGKDMGK